MDKLDTEILNEIQWTFPLVAKPFDEMAKKFGISSDDVKTRLVQLKRKGNLVIVVGSGNEGMKKVNSLLTQDCKIMVISNKPNSQIEKYVKQGKIQV